MFHEYHHDIQWAILVVEEGDDRTKCVYVGAKSIDSVARTVASTGKIRGSWYAKFEI